MDNTRAHDARVLVLIYLFYIRFRLSVKSKALFWKGRGNAASINEYEYWVRVEMGNSDRLANFFLRITTAITGNLGSRACI